jgi:putative endonuclease
MQLLSQLGFRFVRWQSRRGLQESSATRDKKHTALRTGVRGETYAYWYLRHLGYIFIAKNYMPSRDKGEIDLIGFDGNTLAFVEVRTRRASKEKKALPELSITREKHEVLVRTAHNFLREHYLQDCPIRFDVLAIDHADGEPPVVRLHKDALSPQLPPRWH